MKDVKITNYAECLCGGIKVKIRGKLRYVINCHCFQCLKTHGNFASYTSSHIRNLEFINKKTLKWYKSSDIAKRGCCTKCGSSIFYRKINSENISISAGLFSKPTKLKTYANIFVKGKSDYYKLDTKLRKFYKFSR